MDESVRIYQSILDNDIHGARTVLEQYLKNRGLKEVPALPVEHSLAVFKTLSEAGLGRLIARAVRAMAGHPEADFWHRLFYDWGLRGSLGFLVTLELMEQLESEVLGSPRRHAPLRDLVIDPLVSNGDSLVSKRERDLLHELAGRPVRFQAAEAPLYQFALTCMRACLYAGGYWQRTARECLERGSGQLDAMSPYLDQRPLLASMLVQHLLSGYTYLREWSACDKLLERLRAIPAAQDDGIYWQVRLAECRGELDLAHRLLLEAESRGQATSQYWDLRGAAATKREDFREAEECFRRSIAIMGRKPHAYNGILGMSRYRLGNHDEAVRLWETSGSKYWDNLADRLKTKMVSGGLADRVALDIPSIVQKPNHCGPCALSMIARFWGVEMSQEEIAAKLSPWGTQLCELAGFAESRGLAAVFGSRDFDAVVRAVEAGFPVLLVFSHPGGGHYVIAKGYDPNLESLEIRDPDSTYTYLLDRTRYREEAAYHDYQTAVICPPDRAATVPALRHAESLYRDLAKTMVDIRSAQAICEDLASRHSAEALAEFNGFADLQFRKLLDDHQLEAARKLADDILRRNEDGLYACSRVAEVFLRACCVQDAYQAVCRVGSSTNGRGADRRDSLSDLLRDGRSPSHEYLEFIRARCAQQLGNLQVAAISLTRSINRYPVHGGKFLALADLMGRLGEEEEQLKFLDIAQQISGPNTRAATTELTILRRKGDYAAAKDLIEKTLAQFPDEPWLWLEKGQICEEMHLFDEAADCYRRLCEELPHWHRGYTQLLGLFHRAHDIQSGETLLAQLDEKMGEIADRWCVRAYWASLERDWPCVLEAADRCLAQAPGNTWALYFKAEALEAMGRLKEAAAVWQGVVEEADPSDYYWDLAVASLGRLGRKLEDLAAFEATFQHAIGVAPDSPSLWAAMCDCFRFRGRGQEAHQYFESLYQRVTDKAGLSMNVGHLLLDLRLMPEARSWFQRVPSHNAAFPDAVRGIVRSLRDENRLEESLVLLRQTAEQSPSPEMYSLLIEVCLDAYRLDEAAQWLRRSLADYPDTLPDAAYRLARVMDSAGAKEELQSLVEFVEQRKGALVGRSRSDMLLFAAYARRYLGQFPEALALCEEVLSIDPVSGPAWIVKAEVQYEEGDFEGAIVSARSSCATQYSVYPFRCLFEYLRNMGRIEEAFEVCIQGLELFPRDLSFQELLDQLVLEFQMLDRYLEACRRLFPVVEDKASFLGNQGTVFWRMGDDTQAQQLYEQALEYGNYGWLHAQLGVVLREQGDFLGAERELRTAIGLDPHYTYAAQRLAAVYADWFFSYEQLARDFGSDPAFPSQEVLLERIHQFYGKTAEVLPNSDGIFRDYCQFCVRCGDLAPVKRLMPR